MNTRAELFGPSPGGHVWGNTPWEEAYQWEGSRNLGAGRRILEQLEWWRLSPAPELTRGSVGGFLAPKAASLDGRAWLVYFPVHVPPWGKPYVLSGLPPGARLRAAWHNPRDGSRHAIGEVQTSAAGAWQVPPAPVLQDWVLLLERMGPSDASD
jgi:hypothetical protein